MSLGVVMLLYFEPLACYVLLSKLTSFDYFIFRLRDSLDHVCLAEGLS